MRPRGDSDEVDQYLADLQKEELFTHVTVLDGILKQRVWSALEDGLRELDRLPRTDPFWDRTNGRATIHKLRAFADRQQGVPDFQERVAWWIVALGILSCENDFGLEGWRILRGREEIDPGWPLLAAFYTWQMSGVDTSAALVQLADQEGWADALVPLLHQLPVARAEPSRIWISAVEARIRDQNAR